MSRSRNRKRRVTYVNANRRLPLSTFPRVSPLPRKLIQYEDRRLWHPEGIYASARSFSRTRHRLKSVGRFPRQLPLSSLQSLSYRVPASIGFVAPKRVLICVRRNVRKQVLHALRKTGRVGQKKPRFSEYSSISCKG